MGSRIGFFDLLMLGSVTGLGAVLSPSSEEDDYGADAEGEDEDAGSCASWWMGWRA